MYPHDIEWSGGNSTVDYGHCRYFRAVAAVWDVLSMSLAQLLSRSHSLLHKHNGSVMGWNP